jgi:anti-anti-sigma regulatory factor
MLLPVALGLRISVREKVKPTTDDGTAFMSAIINTECGGAQVRAHCRHLAIVVTVAGRIDAFNVKQVSQRVRRFVLANDRVVLDLSDVSSFTTEALALLDALDDECRMAGVDWTLVAGHAVSELVEEHRDAVFLAASVPEALHNFADMIAKRRQLLLPLIKKSA